MNRLTNVVQLTNGTSSASAWYRYDTAGRLWQKGYGNGDVVTHGYDAEKMNPTRQPMQRPCQGVTDLILIVLLPKLAS